jgi:hypothetical protein
VNVGSGKKADGIHLPLEAFYGFLVLPGRRMPYNGTGMKNRSIQGRFGRMAALVLLIPMTMFNASQALTFCVRHDGRMAIEPVIEDHCPCGKAPTGGRSPVGHQTQSHFSNADPDGTTVVVATLSVADTPCQSCTDLSIPVGLCNAPIRAKDFSPLPTSPFACPAFGNHGGLLLPASIGLGETVPCGSPPAWVGYPVLLDSIILRV